MRRPDHLIDFCRVESRTAAPTDLSATSARDTPMSYASLLVHVDVDGRSSIAADLADRFHALLIGLAAWAPMSVFPAEQANPAVGDFHLQDMKTLLDQKGKEFCVAFARPDRKVEWRSILDFP